MSPVEQVELDECPYCGLDSSEYAHLPKHLPCDGVPNEPQP